MTHDAIILVPETRTSAGYRDLQLTSYGDNCVAAIGIGLQFHAVDNNLEVLALDIAFFQLNIAYVKPLRSG